MPYTKTLPQLGVQSDPLVGSDVVALSVDSLGAFAKKATLTQLGAFFSLSSAGVIAPSGDSTGVTDTAAFRAAMLIGGVYSLVGGATYYLAGRVLITEDSSGFVCSDGIAEIVMLTGAGQFDVATYTSIFGAHQCGIVAENVDSPTLHNIRWVMQANAAVRCCIPMGMLTCTNLQIGYHEVTGFKEAYGGLLCIGTCVGGFVGPGYFYDCNPNSTTLPSVQLTCWEIDNFKSTGYSSDIHFFPMRYDNILLGAAATAQYGPQSDAVNVQTLGYGGFVFDMIEGVGVGEVLDCWADNVVANINAKDTQLYALKIINGASNCQITANIDGTGLSAVYMSGSTLKAVANNRVVVNGVNIASLRASVAAVWGSMPAAQPGIYFDNSSTYDPAYNLITGQVWGVSPSVMPNVAGGSTNGLGNVVEVQGGNYTGLFNAFSTATTNVVYMNPIDLGPAKTQVIASGAVRYNTPFMRVDTEGGAGTDDLDTIAVPTDMRNLMLVIGSVSSARVVTVKRNTGNIILPADQALSDPLDRLTLVYDMVAAKWVATGFSNNN